MGFRENLKDELTYKDMQTKELAALTGISLNTLNHYLVQNATSPSVENAVKIAKALNVSVEYLVTGNIENQNESKFSYSSKILRIAQKLSELNERDFNVVDKLIELMKIT
ncbi:MAG: helix-turn-helix transcriptional regulator [Treponema sp.]|nr:helix-turn-helix transcriptional regulator [Treponema sp.]